MEPRTESVKSPAPPWKKTVALRGITPPPAVMPVVLDAGAADLTRTIAYRGEASEEAKGEKRLTSGGCVAVPPVTGRFRAWPPNGPGPVPGPIVSAMVHGGNRIGSTDPEGDP